MQEKDLQTFVQSSDSACSSNFNQFPSPDLALDSYEDLFELPLPEKRTEKKKKSSSSKPPMRRVSFNQQFLHNGVESDVPIPRIQNCTHLPGKNSFSKSGFQSFEDGFQE